MALLAPAPTAELQSIGQISNLGTVSSSSCSSLLHSASTHSELQSEEPRTVPRGEEECVRWFVTSLQVLQSRPDSLRGSGLGSLFTKSDRVKTEVAGFVSCLEPTMMLSSDWTD